MNEKERFYVSDSHTAGATDKKYAMNILSEASLFGAYIRQGESTSDFVFERADKGSILNAKNGIVNLYTLAHVPGKETLTVNYKIDGVWYHATSASPYTCGLAINTLADGAHTVEISAEGMSKTYTFYKSGNSISFGSVPEASIQILVNGTALTFDKGAEPQIVQDRTMVPLRAIFEALNVEVSWDGNTKTVTANGRGRQVILTIGQNEISVNGEKTVIDVPAMIISDRTMVPARAVAQSLGCTVDWTHETKTVVITG